MSDAVGRSVDYPYAPDVLASRMTTGGGRSATPSSMSESVKAALRALAPATAVGAARFLVDGPEAAMLSRQIAKVVRPNPYSEPIVRNFSYYARGVALSARSVGLPLAGQYMLFDARNSDCRNLPPPLVGALTSPLVHLWQDLSLEKAIRTVKPIQRDQLQAMHDFYQPVGFPIPFRYTFVRQTLATSALFLHEKRDFRSLTDRLTANLLVGAFAALVHDTTHTHVLYTPMLPRLAFGTLRWSLLQTVFQDVRAAVEPK